MSMAVDLFSEKPDFPDWLSPMLVKELRQGMRSRAFLYSFMAVQLAMIFIALIGLMNATEHDSNTGVTVFYWMVVCVPLVLVMPSTGLAAIAREKTGNTLEPIFLTRLDARRILAGKWVAIVAQSLLLVSAILPYTVLRYYLGGINLVSELEALGWTVAGSALLTAVMVGISPAVGRFGRVLIPIATIIILYIGAVAISEFANPMLRPSGGGINWKMEGVLVFQGFLFALLMLEVGAGNIAPAAENHSTSKRLLAVVSVSSALVFYYLPGVGTRLWAVSGIIATLAMIGAICEPVCEIPSVYRPFVRRGFAGRLLGRALYPGWPAGFIFCLLLLAIAGFRIDHLAAMHATAGVHLRYPPPQPPPGALLLTRITEVAYAGALFMPMALYRLLRAKKIPALIFYFGFHIFFSLLALFGVLASGSQGSSGIETMLSIFPTCALWDLVRIHDWGDDSQRSVLAGLIIVTVSSILILIVRSWPAWRTISALEKTAAGLSPAPIPPPNPADVARPDEAA
jgi:hypothetical protein